MAASILVGCFWIAVAISVGCKMIAEALDRNGK
jgi:hypothetical protein